jgi:hypothetical protein
MTIPRELHQQVKGGKKISDEIANYTTAERPVNNPLFLSRMINHRFINSRKETFLQWAFFKTRLVRTRGPKNKMVPGLDAGTIA